MTKESGPPVAAVAVGRSFWRTHVVVVFVWWCPLCAWYRLTGACLLRVFYRVAYQVGGSDVVKL